MRRLGSAQSLKVSSNALVAGTKALAAFFLGTSACYGTGRRSDCRPCAAFTSDRPASVFSSLPSSDLLIRGRLFPGKRAGPAGLEELIGIDACEELDQFCNDAGPAGLVAGSQPRPVIPVEVLVEQNVVLPVRIGLEFLGSSVHWTAPRLVSQKNPGQPVGNLPGYLEQIHSVT